MFGKIAICTLVMLVVLMGGFAIRQDNLSRKFRKDIATCETVRNESKSGVPFGISAFCQKIKKEVAARANAEKEYRIQYLKERAQDES